MGSGPVQSPVVNVRTDAHTHIHSYVQIEHYVDIAFNNCTGYFAVVECGVPESPADGSVHANGTVFDSVATYNCSVGYSRHGNMTARCLASGRWSGAPPICSCEQPLCAQC